MGLGKLVKDLASSGPDMLPAEPANTAGQKPTQRQIFQSRYNHGPNLGGMFVLERWISGDALFDGTDKGSELEAVTAAVKKEGVDGARSKFEGHWTSWLSDNDWQWLQEKGVTGVRVPVGYWTVGNGQFTRGTPFEKFAGVYSRAWDLFKSLVLEKAQQHGIAVLVDLHGLPGGANGEEHSGTSSHQVQFWSSSSSVKLAVEVVGFIAKDLASVDNVSGIQVVNEAPYTDNFKSHHDFYLKALHAVRQVNRDVPVVISDAWNLGGSIEQVKSEEQRLAKHFNDTSGGGLGVIIDTHVYKCFSDSDRAKAPSQLIRDVDGAIPQTDAADILVGEFSCVLDEKSWNQCHDNRDQVVAEYGCKQMQHFHERGVSGSYFWTYKFSWGSGGEWGFREMIDKRALVEFNNSSKPADFYHDQFSSRLNTAKSNHVDYWTKQDPKKDWQHWRFDDGFTAGWNDAQAFDEVGHSEIGRLVAWKRARQAQHVKAKGLGEMVWVWNQAFDQGRSQFQEARVS